LCIQFRGAAWEWLTLGSRRGSGANDISRIENEGYGVWPCYFPDGVYLTELYLRE
jgi:hypothetical protein